MGIKIKTIRPDHARVSNRWYPGSEVWGSYFGDKDELGGLLYKAPKFCRKKQYDKICRTDAGRKMFVNRAMAPWQNELTAQKKDDIDWNMVLKKFWEVPWKHLDKRAEEMLKNDNDHIA